MFDGIKSGGLDMRRTPWRTETRENKAETEGEIRYNTGGVGMDGEER